MKKSFFRRILESADDSLRAGIVMSAVIQCAEQRIYDALCVLMPNSTVPGSTLTLQGVYWGNADEGLKTNPRECIFVSMNVTRETVDGVLSGNDLFAIPLVVVNADQHICAAHEFVRDRGLRRPRAAEPKCTAVFSFDFAQGMAPHFESVKDLH